MKIYQKHYINNLTCIKRELKDVGEKLYNLDKPYYLTIEEGSTKNLIVVKLYHIDHTFITTWQLFNNQNLIYDIRSIMRYYT